MALLKPVMALGTSSLLTQLSIVVITVVNNILLVKYGAGSVYGADIPLAAVAAQESGLAQDFISGINSDENAVMRELYLTADPVKRAVAAQEKAICHIADAARSAYLKAFPGKSGAIHTTMNCALTHRWARRLQQT